jgi:hypothetical protein
MQSLEHKALAQTARPPFQERQQSMAPFYRGHRLLMLTLRQGWSMGNSGWSMTPIQESCYSMTRELPVVTFMGATLMVLHS